MGARRLTRRQRSQLRRLERELRLQDPDLCARFSAAATDPVLRRTAGSAWPLPLRHVTPSRFAFAGALFLAVGCYLQVTSAACFGLALVCAAWLRRSSRARSR